MRKYLMNYGWSFSHKACDYAISLMRKKNPTTGKDEKIEVKTKSEVDDALAKESVTLKNNHGYDYVYVYHMGNADYLGSSIADDRHLALYVKDVIDDTDNEGGNVFRKWYADMVGKGMPVDWEEML